MYLVYYTEKGRISAVLNNFPTISHIFLFLHKGLNVEWL